VVRGSASPVFAAKMASASNPPSVSSTVVADRPGAPTIRAKAPSQTVDVALCIAQAAHEASTKAVRQIIGWAFGPNMNPQWWAVMGGVEHGPIEFGKIFEWAVAGRLQPTDYVRNGVFGQYGVVANLPSFFDAAAIMRRADEAFELARSRAAQSAPASTSIPA